MDGAIKLPVFKRDILITRESFAAGFVVGVLVVLAIDGQIRRAVLERVKA